MSSDALVPPTLMLVSDGGEPRWLAYLDAQQRVWSYLPNTGLFHRNPGLFDDLFGEHEFAYAPIDATRARELIAADLGRRPDQSAVIRVLGRQETCPVEAILPERDG